METDDEGEATLDSTTGSLVAVDTGSGLKGSTGRGSGDGCAYELGRVWKGTGGGSLNGDIPGRGGSGGGAVRTGSISIP